MGSGVGDVGGLERDGEGKKEDIKSTGRQKDLVAVRWFWLLADENSSLDVIPGCEWYTLYRDERLPLCYSLSACMEITPRGSYMQVTL